MSAIASFYAQMSFNVDSTGLVKFREEMTLVKREMGGTLALVAATAKALKSMLDSFGKMQHSFDAKSMQSWRKSIAAAARAYVKVMEASNGVLHQVAQEASKSQIKLSNFEKRLNSNIVALNSYAHALMPVVLLLERLRGAAGSPLPRVDGGFRGGGNGGSGAGGGAPHPPSGAGAGGMGGTLAGAGLMSFLKPMLPMGMGIGGMLGGGYAFRELIGAGREMFAMELKMKAVSKSSEAFANNMKFVRELSQQLGLDLVGAGNAYAQIVVTAQEKMNPEQMQKMFTGFNKYYATVHMTTEDQRLANLAIQQMFGKDKIQAQEARLQMGQRVTPFIKLLTEAAKEKLGDKFTTFDDVMKRGLLDPATLLPVVADKLTIIANTGGSLAEALQNSQVAQARFNNSLKEFSYIVMKGGLDHLLAVMFTIGSEAVPMAAKAIKGLMHSIKNVHEFVNFVFTDIHTWLAVTLVAAVTALGFIIQDLVFGTAVSVAVAQMAFYNLRVAIVAVGSSIAATLAPLALFVAGYLAIADMVDLIKGENAEESWLVALVSTVDLLLSNVSVWMSDFEVWILQIRSKLNLLPKNMMGDTFTDEGVNRANNATRRLLDADNGKPKFDASKWLTPKATPSAGVPVDQSSTTINITLPQLSPAEANMISGGDVKGFAASLGNSVYKALSDYTAYTS